MSKLLTNISLRLILSFACFLFSYSISNALVIHVPSDSTSIQGGINGALNGDTVLVADGVYQENIDFLGKAIVVISENGPDFTTIEIDSTGIPVVSFVNNEDYNSRLKGFTILGDHSHYGIYCNNTSPFIYNNIIKYHAIGVVVDSGEVYIRRNEISYCDDSVPGASYGAGIHLNNCSNAMIDSNSIHNNGASYGGAIYTILCFNITIKYNIIYSNYSNSGTSIFVSNGQMFLISHNTITNNSCWQFYGIVCLYLSSNIDIIGNIIAFNGGYGIDNQLSSYFSIFRNDIYGNYHEGLNNLPFPEDNIILDPMFIDYDNNDFRLSFGSPCIDTTSSSGDPDGTAPDMGAIYFNTTPGIGYIVGNITDELGVPIENVVITILNTPIIDISDIYGDFWLSSLNTPVNPNILLSHPDYADTIINNVLLFDGDTATVSIEMQTPGMIAGVVLNQDLLPIEGVIVSADGANITAETNHLGQYYLGWLYPETYNISFDHDCYFDTAAASINVSVRDTTILNAEMLASGSIKGFVMNDQMEPVFNADVKLKRYTAIIDFDHTNQFGRYEFTNFIPDEYKLAVSHMSYNDTTISGIDILGGIPTIQNIILTPLPEYDVTVWLGSPDGSLISAPIGGKMNFDVYIQTSELVYSGQIHIPLCVNDQYITGLHSQVEGQMYYPLTEWDSTGFREPDDSLPDFPGWTNQTFSGKADTTIPYSGVWIHSDTPTKILTFVVETVDDSLLVGDTIKCICSGVDVNDYPDINYPLSVFDSLCSSSLAIDLKVSPLCFGLPSDYGAIVGTVADDESNVIEGVSISVAGDILEVQTDSAGDYSFEGIVPERYSLQFSHPLYRDTFIADIFVYKGETTYVDLIIEDLGAIAGSVVDTFSIPLNDVYVEIVGASGINDNTDSIGMYNLNYLEPGSCDIMLSHWLYNDTLITGIVVACGNTYQLDVVLMPFIFDVNLWFGGQFTGDVWHDSVEAVPGDEFDVNVWFGCPEPVYIGELLCVLGVNNDYFSEIVQSECSFNYPLTEWDAAQFTNPASYDDFHSLSFSGTARTGENENPWLHYELPSHILTFVVKSANDLNLIGQSFSDAFMEGIDPVKGGHFAGDTLESSALTLRDKYAKVYFTSPVFEYLPGDVNMFNGIWPPQVIGGDVTYLVNYFRGIESGKPCFLVGFYASADVNGDCQVIGSDVIKLVSYFRGTGVIEYCPDYMPLWPPLPDSPPEGWPNCDTPTIGNIKSPEKKDVKTPVSIK